MGARVLGIVRIPAACDQIFFVEPERFADGQRPALVHGVAGLTTRQRTGHVNRLPIGKDVWRARGLEIIGDRDALDPLGPAVGDAHAPRACASVAPVAEMNAGAYGRQYGFLRTSRRRRAVGVSSLAERGFGMLRVRPVSATMAWRSILAHETL